MQPEERKYEENRLKKTLAEIERQLHEKNKEKIAFEKNMRATYKNMWEEVEGAPNNMRELDQLVHAKAYLDDMRNMESAFKSSAQKIVYLKKMLHNPYFGRIDFKEDGEEDREEIYIGISSVQNEKSLEIFVYDWRAPVSGMFYDFEPGRAMYSSPGGIVKGELYLKRQYRIKDGCMEYMFNSTVKIDDDVLQDILGQSKDEKMKSIVTSIQREQNRAIRDEGHKLLIVEGPAGSGKTSVALHRIAFLLYRYRNIMNSSNVVIFSPNELFNDYISEVLPELGEENVRQTTFMEYAKSVLKTDFKVSGLNQQMEYILSHKNSPFYRDNIAAIKYKSSMTFLNILKKYIEWLNECHNEFEDFLFQKEMIISSCEQAELFKTEYAFLPYIPRLLKIKNRILYLIKKREGERMAELLHKYGQRLEWSDLKPTERKKRVARIVLKEFAPLRGRARQIGKIKILDLYKELFLNVDLMNRFEEKIEYSANYADMAKLTLKRINRKRLFLEDLAPLLYMQGKLKGMPNTASIRHVIIDEAQDYTPIQMQIINELFPNSSFTMVGDLNQSINPYANIDSMDTLSDIFNVYEKVHIKMVKSYRSTSEITRFCNRILSKEQDIEYINREGKPPCVIDVNSMEECVTKLSEDIKKLQDDGYRSIAVIGKTERSTRDVYQQLKNRVKCHLVLKEDTAYATGVTVISSYLAKGLEFDAVLVLNLPVPYQGAEERNLFYTVCTRALHSLSIYASRDGSFML